MLLVDLLNDIDESVSSGLTALLDASYLFQISALVWRCQAVSSSRDHHAVRKALERQVYRSFHASTRQNADENHRRQSSSSEEYTASPSPVAAGGD